MSDASTQQDADAVAGTAAKVREYLSSFDDVDQNDDGTCSLQYGSARVDVTVGTFDEDQAIVKVRACCVSGATATPELYQYIATTEAEVGHLTVTESGGKVDIHLSHGLMGEFLNPAELRMTVVAVAYGADKIDDELATRFGGSVYDAAANTNTNTN